QSLAHLAGPTLPPVDSTSRAPVLRRDRPAESEDRVSSPDAERSPAAQQALQLFCDDILQRYILQGEIRIHPLQATILMLQLFEPLHVGGLYPTVLRLPLVVGRRADAIVPPDLIDRAPGIRLLQNGHNLCLGKLRLPHGNLLAKGDHCARRFSRKT